MDRTLQDSEEDFSSDISVGTPNRMEESSEVSYWQSTTIQPVRHIRKGGAATTSCVGDYLEYEVEGVLRHKGKGPNRRYLVMWRGYPLTEATWEPASSFTHAQEILQDYLRRVDEARIRATRSKRVVGVARS